VLEQKNHKKEKEGERNHKGARGKKRREAWRAFKKFCLESKNGRAEFEAMSLDKIFCPSPLFAPSSLLLTQTFNVTGRVERRA